ncbi:hypothetical protein [Nocardioides sp. Kera G14]|uniref:hypothetical protein n=1 Tax=Nocardioides sp. Kera G14 TaxID=2884264 RepID=UPI001D110F98|nr:hypothetical protein [Nocardioides sp. Kera G14]UDY23901.1 hypothetical protein LH076_00960 [Nocardioides sp. Kera G14]
MNKHRVVLPGLIVGALLLALVAVFAIFLPKVEGKTGDLTLPATLPGGYVAADRREAYESLTSATDADKANYVTSQVNAGKFAAKSYKAMGVEGVSRNYLTKDGQQFVAVQLIRAQGGAISPFLFTDPKTAEQGTQLDHYVKAGDATCIETGTSDGAGKVQQSVIECQKSEDGLTLQVTTQNSISAVGKLIDAIWDDVA